MGRVFGPEFQEVNRDQHCIGELKIAVVWPERRWTFIEHDDRCCHNSSQLLMVVFIEVHDDLGTRADPGRTSDFSSVSKSGQSMKRE